MGLRVLGTMGLQWDNWVFVSWGGGGVTLRCGGEVGCLEIE